ncbi:MAG TPA: TIGR03759 family integrating conjugative element protein [Woeseiaceae bacterium]|nr:TIGR03759 family integrating conjugative element protein [Woeseiaceae bacterium]
MNLHLAVKGVLANVLLISFSSLYADESPAVSSDARSSDIEITSETQSTPWALSEGELERAETLLQGLRGALSDTRISPIEVLGIHARTEAERRRYAEQWARLQIADAERVLAFERAYRVAVRDLLGNKSVINRQWLQPRTTGARLEANDRLLFFTRTDCAACVALGRRVLKQAGQLAGIDIYLVDETDPVAIRAWAEAQHIDPSLVKRKAITLNSDAGLLERLTGHTIEPPYLLRQRGTSLKPIVLLGSP